MVRNPTFQRKLMFEGIYLLTISINIGETFFVDYIIFSLKYLFIASIVRLSQYLFADTLEKLLKYNIFLKCHAKCHNAVLISSFLLIIGCLNTRVEPMWFFDIKHWGGKHFLDCLLIGSICK